MKTVPFYTILFYYGVLASIIVIIIQTIECYRTNKPAPTFTYTLEQYLIIALAGFVAFIALSCQCIAMQNDKPAFLGIIAYMGLIYGFIFDTFIFGTQFANLQILGIFIVVAMNLTLLYEKLSSIKEDPPK